MHSKRNRNASGVRMPENRQTTSTVPARGRSGLYDESCEGLATGLPTSSVAEPAIVEAARPTKGSNGGVGGRSTTSKEKSPARLTGEEESLPSDGDTVICTPDEERMRKLLVEVAQLTPEVVLDRISPTIKNMEKICRDLERKNIDDYIRSILKHSEEVARILARRLVAHAEITEAWKKHAQNLESERDEFKKRLERVEERMNEVIASSKKNPIRQRTIGTGTNESYLSAMEERDTSMVTPGVARPVKPTPRKLRFSVSEEKTKRRQKMADTRTYNRDYPSLPRSDLTWSTVTKRGKKNASMEDKRAPGGRERAEPPTRRAPRATRGSTAAVVTLTCDEAGPSYAEALNKARKKISLEELGIPETRMRRAFTGGLIIEIPGEEAPRKADLLAKRLKEVLGEQVKIRRPTKQAEIRIAGLDESVEVGDIVAEISRLSGAQEGDIRVAPIRLSRNGFGSTVVRCPAECADRVVERGRIRVGWTSARVELLGGRLPKCYRCFATGHVRARCPSRADNSTACLNCGMEGHVVSDCESDAWCGPCTERGLPADHRAGGRMCPPWAPTREVVRHSRKEGVPRHRTGGPGESGLHPEEDEDDSPGQFRDCLSSGRREEVRASSSPEMAKVTKRRKVEETGGRTGHRRAARPTDEAMEAEPEGLRG